MARPGGSDGNRIWVYVFRPGPTFFSRGGAWPEHINPDPGNILAILLVYDLASFNSKTDREQEVGERHPFSFQYTRESKSVLLLCINQELRNSLDL